MQSQHFSNTHTTCRGSAWKPFGAVGPRLPCNRRIAAAVRKSHSQQQDSAATAVNNTPSQPPPPPKQQQQQQQLQEDSGSPTPPPPPPTRPSAWGPVLVDGLVVQPAYRSTPWEAEAKRAATAQDKAVVMFVSESGICRGPLAAAAFSHLLQHSPLKDWVQVDMRATRDYCEGQQPDAAAAAAADTLGFSLSSLVTQTQQPPTSATAANGSAVGANGSSSSSNGSSSGGAAAAAGDDVGVRVFHPSDDIVAADLVLVMDKYTAADVLREVSAYDLINPGGRYSSRVRLLGSYHPQLASRTQTPDGQDIDDALYGNEGGDEQNEAALAAAKLIIEACRNLLLHLEDLAISQGLIASANLAAGAGGASAGGGSVSSSSESGSGSESNTSDAVAAAAAGGAKFKAVLAQSVQEEGVMDWLVPPMLQGSNVDVDGWV